MTLIIAGRDSSHLMFLGAVSALAISKDVDSVDRRQFPTLRGHERGGKTHRMNTETNTVIRVGRGCSRK